MSQCESTAFMHPGISSSSTSMYLYQSPQHQPFHHHHHHHHFHHNHHHLNTINVNMKIVSPPVASSPLNTSAAGNYIFPNSNVDDQILYNRNCSSTSTNSSSSSSFSNPSCNNNASGNNNNNDGNVNGNCTVINNAVIKKEENSVLDNLYEEMTYQPNYYPSNSTSYQLPEASYLHNNSPSTTSYYAWIPLRTKYKWLAEIELNFCVSYSAPYCRSCNTITLLVIIVQ